VKSQKTISIITLLAFVSAVALVCAGFIVQMTTKAPSEANTFQAVIWQRETQTLIVIGIYFAFFAGSAFIFSITTRLLGSRWRHNDKTSK